MSNLANFIYDRTIDYIENRANDSEVRYSYAVVMSERNWNNNEMANLVDTICVLAENELQNSRSDREDETLVKKAITVVTDAHCGYYGMSNRKIADSVPDDVYNHLRRAAGEWEDISNAVRGGRRGGGGGQRREFGGSGGSATGRRSVFGSRDEGNFGQRRSVFSEGREERASNGSAFGGAGRSRVFDEPIKEQAAPEVQRGAWTHVARAPEPPQAPAEQREELVSREGPDMSKERPYDDFWMNGEQWQIAHRSKFVWTWSQKQQTRRAYDPEKEVRFLVKGVDGSVREEFIDMTDDLTEEAHEIRAQHRPNRPRIALDSVDYDIALTGDDIDAVDLDALENTYRCARREFLGEVSVNSPVIDSSGVAVSNLEDGILMAAGNAAKHDADVVAVNTINGVQLATDARTISALESVTAITATDSDLLVLQKRLKSLRGVITENVMNFLDNHFTKEVNDALADQFGLPLVKIESFVEDFEDLLGCRTFVKQGTAYASQFLSRTRILLAGLHYMTSAAERMEYLDCNEVLPVAEEDTEQYHKFRESVVVLFRPRAMVHVKVNADVFGMVTNEMRVPVRTGKHADPVMADLLKSLYAIGRQTSGAGRVYMVTADNLCFELVAASGARDIIGIRTAQ